MSLKSILINRGKPVSFDCEFAKYTATLNLGTESWVPSDFTTGIGYHTSVRIPKGFVQTDRIRSGDGPKVALESWLASVYIYPVSIWERAFETIPFLVEKRLSD